MRLSSLFIRLAVFVLAALLSVLAARATVSVVEARSVLAVQEDLVDQRYEWARVVGDGLQVILEGEAPSEATRFRAISAAGRIVDASRVIDNMSVKDTAGIAPPEFTIEILRNDSGVSLIGLIPANTDRDALSARITRIASGKPVTDLLEVADYPVPENWDDALNYALRALSEMERSKISVSARRVAVNGISDSADEKRRLEALLARGAPPDVAVAVSITAPRPVISPFTTRFTLDENGARFVACAVDTEENERLIVAAATDAGFVGKASCVRALGVPSRTWGEAVARSIGAVKALGGGTVTLSDTDVALVAPIGTDQSLFDEVVGTLENTLPDVFALTATLSRAPEAGAEGPPQFSATLSPEGQVQLRGRVPDDLANTTAENYAKARFGQGKVVMGTRVVEGLPAGWSVRVLTAIEALSQLSNGAVLVQPDLVRINGATGNANASAEIAALLVDKLGQSAKIEINVDYQETLDPVANMPTPEECIAEVDAVTEKTKILFDPGATSISSDTQPVVDAIAEILRRCADMKIRIAGYTDSQGGEEMNQQLSQQRAEAVLDALRLRRVPVAGFEAVGYGEADPIADNETEAGREANRRIEFTLITPAPTEAGADAPAADGTAAAQAATEANQ